MLDMAKRSPNWFAEVLTVDDTKLISMEAIEEQRREYHSIYGVDAGDALIQQEYWCSFEAAILGAYWGREMSRADADGRIGEVHAHEDYPVHTAWDLGVDDAMAIWDWQAVEGRILVLNYEEAHGYGIAYYAERIHERRRERGWKAGMDFVPHDAKVREMTSSGKDGKAKQRIEVMLECGLRPKLIPDHKLMDGISAVRQILHRCWWSSTHCEQGIECLRQYQTEWDDDLKVFKKTPLHNWASYGADAKRTLAMAYREMAPAAVKEPGRMLTIGAEGAAALPPGVKPVTLNDLWDMRRRPSKRF
jgi:hypothetical protein